VLLEDRHEEFRCFDRNFFDHLPGDLVFCSERLLAMKKIACTHGSRCGLSQDTFAFWDTSKVIVSVFRSAAAFQGRTAIARFHFFHAGNATRDFHFKSTPQNIVHPFDMKNAIACSNTLSLALIVGDSEATWKRDTIFNAGLEYGIMGGIMDTARKITVEVPLELLEKAQRASGTGVTQTVRTGLQLVAASRTYARLRKLRGKVRFSRTVAELKADR
jgi:hypothetical protein